MRSLAAIKHVAWRVLGVILRRPLRFNWVINGELAWASQICSNTEMKGIWRRGVRAILTLTEDPIPAGAAERLGMTLMHCPIRDHAPPTFDQIEQCLNFLDSSISSQKRVVVHCEVGKGRSGTIIAAYLMKRNGYAPSHAIDLLREIRAKSVEPNQEFVLIKYYETRGCGRHLETR